MKRYRAGEDIVAHCGRCKMDLLHVIHAEVEGRPARVECKTCRAIHSYRAPKSGVHKSDAPPPARAGSSGGSSSSGSSRSSSGSARTTTRKVSGPTPADLYQAAIEGVDLSEPRAYRMTERFEEGEVINHMTFGVGLVTKIPGEQKMEAIFESGTKLLVHNKG